MCSKKVAYRLNHRFEGKIMAREVVYIHFFHAKANDGKVLFTTNDIFPKEEHRGNIEEIILMIKSGEVAIRAKVDDLNEFKNGNPPDGYNVPSIWNGEDKTDRSWFALSNLEETSIKKGDYKGINDKDLLDSISGAASMVYYK